MAFLETWGLKGWASNNAFLKLFIIKVSLPFGHSDVTTGKQTYFPTRDGLKLTDLSHKLLF